MPEPTRDRSAVFLEALSPAAREALSGGPALEGALDRLVEQAAAGWPELALPEADFLRFVARRIPGGPGASGALERLNAPDLYLACGCASGDDAAVAAFAARHFPTIDRALAPLGVPRAMVEDVRQAIFQKLFVGDAEHAARISHYAGEGDLGTWVRVVAVRQAIDVLRREGREVPLSDEALPELVVQADDPELRFLKQRYRVEFKEVFHQVLATLSSQERNVLRYQVVGGLTMEQIAALYQVNRSTVVRWLHAVRDKLLRGTRRALSERLRIDRAEFESVMRLIQSQLQVSVKRLLERDED